MAWSRGRSSPALSLAHIETNPSWRPGTISSVLLHTVPFCGQGAVASVYIRLLFASGQDLNSMPSMPGRFQSIASGGATRHRKEVLEGDSLVAILFRCEL